MSISCLHPLIDVLIPVFNAQRWIAESIRSICRQTHSGITIHVVDDGSTDDTPAILEGLAATDPRIHVHTRPNGGIVEALNHGLRFCTAPYLARHDADDVSYPTRFAAQLAYLESNPGCVAVGAIAQHIDGDGRPLGTFTELRPPEQADLLWAPALEPYLMHPFMMARRKAIMKVGGYRRVTNSEDSDLYWRLRDLGSLHNLPEILGEYRMHDDSVSGKSVEGGRMMAVNSQLAALSARRRERGAVDLVFDQELAVALRAAVTLAAMLEVAKLRLEPGEQRWIGIAVSAKLLELASYLPYQLEAEDCRFIGHWLERSREQIASTANRRFLSSLATRTAVKLTRNGRFQAARALLPKTMWLEFALRYGLSSAAVKTVRRLL